MIQVDFEPSFERALKKMIKRNRLSSDDFWERLELFMADPYALLLQTHNFQAN